VDAFPFFRLPAFFAFTLLSFFAKVCVCVDFQDLSACLATFVVFAQTSHIFLCGVFSGLPFYCCQRHENFNFHTGALVFVEKININHTPQWPL